MSFYYNNLDFFNVITLIIASAINLSLSFIFSLIETSLIITDDLKFETIIKKTKDIKKKRRLNRILKKRDKYGASLSVAITLTNVTGSSILGTLAAKYLNSTFVIIFTIMITYLMLVFARTVPKIYARKVNAETLIKYVSLIQTIYSLCIPILWFTLIWIKILKLERGKKILSITELKEIVAIYKSNGVIKTSEENILSNLFDLREISMDVFTKKNKKYVSVYAYETLEENREKIIKSKYKKMLVKNNKEEIIGIVNDNNLVHALLNNKGDKKISDFTKNICFINELDKVIDAISKMDHNKSQAVILNDENMVVGIVSMKDMYFYLAGKK